MSDVSLTDTYWKLVELDGRAAELGAGERPLHLVLTSKATRVSGFSGCNRFVGSYELDGDQLQFGQLASTRMACAQGMQQEQRFLHALRLIIRFTIHGSELALYGSDERPALLFASGVLPSPNVFDGPSQKH